MTTAQPIKPCAPDRDHDWEIVVRCRTCGFQIATETHVHHRQPVRDALTSALQNLFRLRRPNATAAGLALGLLLAGAPAAGQELDKALTPSLSSPRSVGSAPKRGQTAPKAGTREVATEVVVTADVGRVYSVPDGRYLVAAMPGVEVTRGPLAASALLVLERSEDGGPETDLGLAYARDLHPRVTWSTTVNYYRYLDIGYDATWSTGLRIKLR